MLMQNIHNVTKSSSLFLAAVLMLHCIGSAQASDSLKGFKEIKVAPGYAQADSLIGTVLPFLQGHPETDESAGKLDVQVRKSGNGYQVNIIKDGYLDDSVRGDHFRGYVIFTSTGKWELLSMHVKPLCYRGEPVEGLCL